LSQPRRKRLSFDSFLCWLGLQTPHKKKKVGSQSFGVSQNIFSLSALWVSGARERERERERERVGEDVVRWWAGGFAGSSYAASI